MTADSWSTGLRGPDGGRFSWCGSARRLRLLGRLVFSAAFATIVLITTSRLETSLRASAGSGAPNAAPVLTNPGNQTNTDNSSYEQVIVADNPAAYCAARRSVRDCYRGSRRIQCWYGGGPRHARAAGRAGGRQHGDRFQWRGHDEDRHPWQRRPCRDRRVLRRSRWKPRSIRKH